MRSWISIFLLCGCLTNAYGQITVTSDGFVSDVFAPTVRQAFWSSDDTTGLRALIALNGGSQTWDFTGRAYSLQTNGGAGTFLPFNSSLPLASDPDFSSATNAIMDSSSPAEKRYEFYRIDSSGFWLLGSSQDSMGVASKVDRYSPPFLEVQFPLTYLSTWQGSTTYYDLKYPDTSIQTCDGGVDGFGVITLPSLANQMALRVRLHFTNVYSGGGTNQNYSYLWFTNNGCWASIDADDSGKPMGVNFVQPIVNAVLNPAISSSNDQGLHVTIRQETGSLMTLRYTLPAAGPVLISLFDVVGRNVRTLVSSEASAAGENNIFLDGNTLPAGMYFVRVEANGVIETQKLTICR